MQIRVKSFTVNKRVPLTISRGTVSQSTNLCLILEHDGIEGWGEASPFSIDGTPQTAEAIAAQLNQLAPQLASCSPFDRQKIDHILHSASLLSAGCTALDLALHDWLGKRLGVPLWKLWGLDRQKIVPISVTIGISSPEAAQDRLRKWLEVTTVKAIKVKLGNPNGIEADQAMLKAILVDAPAQAVFSVDANGGWSLEDAIAMSHWLESVGVTYIEQPLPRGEEDSLPPLYRESPLPIFVDESCFDSHDIPALADRVHGINIKLMKSGGLAEALRMIHTARAHGLKIMYGCYSDTALSNTAAAQLAPLADYLDLDSHLNLTDDPFVGADLHEGRLIPTEQPGLGVSLANDRG